VRASAQRPGAKELSSAARVSDRGVATPDASPRAGRGGGKERGGVAGTRGAGWREGMRVRLAGRNSLTIPHRHSRLTHHIRTIDHVGIDGPDGHRRQTEARDLTHVVTYLRRLP